MTPRYCPFLGCVRDRASVVDHPSMANTCYAEGSVKWRIWIVPMSRPYRRVGLKTQEDVCMLRAKWAHCPLYLKREEIEGFERRSEQGFPPGER